ncbi:MAG TPA: DUF3501 family protein [Acidimicrobiia bacterium]|nr:DUF3501 family protein [Acidimicrobiia bacterium]
MQKLTLADIKDVREYEREREEFRARIIEMKKRRRVPLGDIITLTFENTDTMRFQVQEMARVERIITDEAIEHEVETYNQLIPDDGELSATLFIEINDKAGLMEWLPKLVGIQRAVQFDLGAAGVVAPVPQNEDFLTREEVTASVHYVKFPFSGEQAQALRDGPAALVADHEHYQVRVDLDEPVRHELASDLGL